MSEAVILDENDVRQLIADDYGVSLEDVIKSQYSYVVKLKEKKADGLGG
jgi:hypothetical protein